MKKGRQVQNADPVLFYGYLLKVDIVEHLSVVTIPEKSQVFQTEKKSCRDCVSVCSPVATCSPVAICNFKLGTNIFLPWGLNIGALQTPVMRTFPRMNLTRNKN